MARKRATFEISAAMYQGRASEASWQATVIEAAHWHGWEVLLVIPKAAYGALAQADEGRFKGKHGAMKAIKAQPDLLLGNRRLGRTIAVECKTADGDYEPGQEEKLEAYAACGTPSYTWRPADYYDRVVPVLEGSD